MGLVINLLVSLLVNPHVSAQQLSTAAENVPSDEVTATTPVGSSQLPPSLLSSSLLSEIEDDRSGEVTVLEPIATTSSESNTTSDATTTFSSASPSTSNVIGITGTPKSTASQPQQPQATNERPCNGHPSYCNRKFSNVSMVVAHNSPYVVPDNAASNQIYPVLDQLNDGIRGLQFGTHMPNESYGLHLCHTSCDILDAGPLEEYLQTVSSWLAEHPYEVIAIMMGNGDRVSPTEFVAPFQNAGLMPYLYVPPQPSMNLSDWPTLSEMIIKNKRVVAMLDYEADQSQVPWLLDQFSYQWQTPFSPTDPDFPCTQQRPPGQADAVSRNRMYMLNHNLNIEVKLVPSRPAILIPAYTLLDQVNAVSGNGSLGRNVEDCKGMWDRAPNWLLVDYYNFGNFNGSVFEVASEANGVEYNRERCCGGEDRSAGIRIGRVDALVAVAAFLFAIMLL